MRTSNGSYLPLGTVGGFVILWVLGSIAAGVGLTIGVVVLIAGVVFDFVSSYRSRTGSSSRGSGDSGGYSDGGSIGSFGRHGHDSGGHDGGWGGDSGGGDSGGGDGGGGGD